MIENSRPSTAQSTLIVLAALLLSLCCWNWSALWAQEVAANSPTAEPATEAIVLIETGALVIDVRSPEEFKTGHLEGALNIVHTDVDGLEEAIGENHGRSVVLYCRSGGRAGKAQVALQERGYTAVHNGTGYQSLAELLD